MSATNNSEYSLIAKLLHWSMALVIIGLIGVGIYMADLPRDTAAQKQYAFQFYGLHKSFGVIALLLIMLRLAWHRLSPPPALPQAFEEKEQRVIKTLQRLLYLLMVLVPLSGYLMSNAGGHPIKLFGQLDMPALIAKSKAVGGFTHEAHEIMGFAMLLIVLLHMAGAIKHRISERGSERDILKRML